MENIFFITEKDSEDNTDTAARIISEKARALRNDNKNIKIGYMCKTPYQSKKKLQKLSDKTDSDLSTGISKISQMSLLFTEDDRQQKNDIIMYPIALNDPMWSKGSKTGATIKDRAYAFWLTPYKAENGTTRLLIEDYSDKKYCFQLRKNILNYPINYNFDEERFDIWKDAFFGVSYLNVDNSNILINAADQLLNTSLIEKFKELLINNFWEKKLYELIISYAPTIFSDDISIVEHTEDTPFTVFLMKLFRSIYAVVSNKITWNRASNVCNDWMEFIIGFMKKLNSEYMNFDLILIDENISYSDIKARIEEADKLRYAQNINNKDKMKISILGKPDVYIMRSDSSDKSSDEKAAEDSCPPTEKKHTPPKVPSLKAEEPTEETASVPENSFNEWYGNDVKKNILRGKILVVGNNGNGRTLLFREAERRKNQGGIVGVEQKSIVEIALPIVAEALARSKTIDELKKISVQPISSNTASGIIMSMIRKESKFSKEMLTKNTADELLRIINMLRMNECADRVETEGFDIWRLKEEYEKFLNDNGLYDNARLLSEAVGYLEGQGNKNCIAYNYDYAVMDDHTPTMLEKKLLNKLCGNKINVISVKTKAKTKPSFFKAYGMADEILTIANKIKNEKLYAGDTAIYYTNKAYINMIKAVFAYYSIPVFFAEGKAAGETSRFRLWDSILDWWENDCRMTYFESILMNKSLKIISDDGTGTIVSKEKILEFFRRNVGCLFGRKNHFRIAQAEDSGEDHYKKYAITIVRDLVGIFCDLDNNEYEISQSYNLSELFGKMSAFIKKYCPDEKEMILAEKKINDELKYNNSDYSDKEACELLKKLIGSVRIRDRYDADAAVAMPLTNRKSISPKAHTFVVGMSTSLVLKKADESPLITDKKIGELLDGEIAALYQGSSKNDLMLASAEYLCNTISDNGSLCISYPYYDQANLRHRSSSYIFEKLAEGVSQIEDHNSLGFLSSYDSFENESKKQNVFVLEKSNDNNQKNKGTGQSETPANISLKLSASALHKLLVCPRKYIIENIYCIKDEPEEKKDSYRWLEANQKGTFFHSVMEQYIDEYCGDKNKNLIDRAETVKKFIFDETEFEDVFNRVKKETELIPYELLAEKDHEIDEIREAAKAYLENLSSDNSGYTPCAVEYKFDKDYEDRDLGLTYNIGFIDRIDVRKDDDGKLHFRIVDYKTGKFDTFMKNYKIILVQHYVYMKFLENEVNNAAVVDGFEFVFPFEKEKVAYEYKEDGTFEDLRETPDCTKIIYNGKAVINETVKKLLEKIKNELKNGKYLNHSYSDEILGKNKPKNPTYDEIQYCPFKDICGNCK